MAIVNSRAAIEPKTGKAAIFVNETIHSLIRKLFANGEQGFFYDPNDLSTMFQDAAGTVPVTGVGQPVGLMLDKSKGLVYGLPAQKFQIRSYSLMSLSQLLINVCRRQPLIIKGTTHSTPQFLKGCHQSFQSRRYDRTQVNCESSR